MNDRQPREICRWWQAVFPHWAIATAAAASVVLAASHLAVDDAGLVVGLCAPAIVWAAGHTIRWTIRRRRMAARESRTLGATIGERRASGAAQASVCRRRAAAEVTDYGWFMAFGNRLMHGGADRSLPKWASRRDAEAWLAVLVEFGVVERVPDGGGYGVALCVGSVEELEARISREAFGQAIARQLPGRAGQEV